MFTLEACYTSLNMGVSSALHLQCDGWQFDSARGYPGVGLHWLPHLGGLGIWLFEHQRVVLFVMTLAMVVIHVTGAGWLSTKSGPAHAATGLALAK